MRKSGQVLTTPAVAREYEVLTDNVTVNYRLERQTFPPQGSHGGGPGSAACCRLRRIGRDWEEVPPKGSAQLQAGESFVGEDDEGTGTHGATATNCSRC